MIETLKDVDNIDGFEVVTMDTLREKYPEKFNESGAMDYKWFESEIRPNKFIYIRHDKHSISFTVQEGPIKEAGVNGCMVETIIATARLIVAGLNKKFPCRENDLAITKLDEAFLWLNARTADRKKRGVEGLNKA